MRTRAEPVFDDIVVTSLTTGKFNRLVNGGRKFEEATGGATLVSDTVLKFATEGDHGTSMVTATPAHVVTAPGINNPCCAVTLTGGDGTYKVKQYRYVTSQIQIRHVK